MLDQENDKQLTVNQTQVEDNKTNPIGPNNEESSNLKVISDENAISDENQKVIDYIDTSNAEESEEETLSERQEIPMLDYEKMSLEELVKELEKLVDTKKISPIKQHIDEIRREFNSKYRNLIEEKKELYASENQGSTLGFEYHFPLKNKFDAIFNQYRERRNEHYKQREASLKNNLNKRLEIIEELKNLLNQEEKIADIFKQFNEIRERWRNAGPIPKDNYNHVWNTYHFHVENFYDYLHLDREIRNLDFKHNLEQKQKIIERAKELINEPSINKAITELHVLHRIWKEELGPVDRKFREQIWNEFKEISRQIHSRRDEYFKKLHKKEEDNLIKKEEIISNIRELINENPNSHSKWNLATEKVKELRVMFLRTGQVALEKREQNWDDFRKTLKEFNIKKITFFKNIRAEYDENLNKKRDLLKKAEELKDSDDFENVTPIMKQIQEDWKTIGKLPKKISDKIWLAFRDACNHYFERLQANRKYGQFDPQAYDKKVDYLKNIENIEFSGDYKSDLELLMAHIQNWKKIGRVSPDKRHIESKYNDLLDVLFAKININKQDMYRLKYSVFIEDLIEADDPKKIESERISLSNKIEKIKGEILQLENNIMFVTGNKDKNPLFAEVKKNIEKSKQELKRFQDRLIQFRLAVRKYRDKQES